MADGEDSLGHIYALRGIPDGFAVRCLQNLLIVEPGATVLRFQSQDTHQHK